MKSEDFNKLAEERMKICNDTLQIKATEYGSTDRLHNFKLAAIIQDITPESALLGMWAKHLVSVIDIVNDIEQYEKLPSKELLSEKITDTINYAVLLEALIEDRRGVLVTSSLAPKGAGLPASLSRCSDLSTGSTPQSEGANV